MTQSPFAQLDAGDIPIGQVPFLTTMLCVHRPNVSLAATVVFLQSMTSSGVFRWAKVENKVQKNMENI